MKYEFEIGDTVLINRRCPKKLLKEWMAWSPLSIGTTYEEMTFKGKMIWRLKPQPSGATDCHLGFYPSELTLIKRKDEV